MRILVSAALLAAGIAWELHRRKSLQEKTPQAEDRLEPTEQSALAEVLHCARRMDPLTLNGASDVTFILADGIELGFHITGEGSLHLQVGDSGLLTWVEDTFLLFEKDNGEIIGGMFYSPAESEADGNE